MNDPGMRSYSFKRNIDNMVITMIASPLESTIGREQTLAHQCVVIESFDEHCVMDFSQSVMPTLLALAVIGTLLLVAFQAAA